MEVVTKTTFNDSQRFKNIEFRNCIFALGDFQYSNCTFIDCQWVGGANSLTFAGSRLNLQRDGALVGDECKFSGSYKFIKILSSRLAKTRFDSVSIQEFCAEKSEWRHCEWAGTNIKRMELFANRFFWLIVDKCTLNPADSFLNKFYECAFTASHFVERSSKELQDSVFYQCAIWDTTLCPPNSVGITTFDALGDLARMHIAKNNKTMVRLWNRDYALEDLIAEIQRGGLKVHFASERILETWQHAPKVDERKNFINLLVAASNMMHLGAAGRWPYIDHESTEVLNSLGDNSEVACNIDMYAQEYRLDLEDASFWAYKVVRAARGEVGKFIIRVDYHAFRADWIKELLEPLADKNDGGHQPIEYTFNNIYNLLPAMNALSPVADGDWQQVPYPTTL